MYTLIVITLALCGISTAVDFPNCAYFNQTKCYSDEYTNESISDIWFSGIETARCKTGAMSLPPRAFMKEPITREFFKAHSTKCTGNEPQFKFEYVVNDFKNCIDEYMFLDVLSHKASVVTFKNGSLHHGRDADVAIVYAEMFNKEIKNTDPFPYYHVLWKSKNYRGVCPNTTVEHLNACMFNVIFDMLGSNYIFQDNIPTGCGVKDPSYYRPIASTTQNSARCVEFKEDSQDCEEPSLIKKDENRAIIIIGLLLFASVVIGCGALLMVFYHFKYFCFKPKKNKVDPFEPVLKQPPRLEMVTSF